MRCPRLVLVEALASPCGLQAGLILASCRTSFNTYVRAERSDGEVSHLPTHAGMPPRRTLPEGRQAREGIFAPHHLGPSVTLQHVSRVAIVPSEKALFLERLPAKLMSAISPSS